MLCVLLRSLECGHNADASQLRNLPPEQAGGSQVMEIAPAKQRCRSAPFSVLLCLGSHRAVCAQIAIAPQCRLERIDFT